MMGHLGFSDCDLSSAIAIRAEKCMEHGLHRTTHLFDCGKLSSTPDARVALHTVSSALTSILRQTSVSKVLPLTRHP